VIGAKAIVASRYSRINNINQEKNHEKESIYASYGVAAYAGNRPGGL
jgi:hypothetical protein